VQVKKKDSQSNELAAEEQRKRLKTGSCICGTKKGEGLGVAESGGRPPIWLRVPPAIARMNYKVKEEGRTYLCRREKKQGDRSGGGVEGWESRGGQSWGGEQKSKIARTRNSRHRKDYSKATDNRIAVAPGWDTLRKSE